jgi:hypothetical protein
MTLFLSAALLLSLLLIGLGFAMDMSAVRGRINGANGFPILISLLLSFAGSLGVALISGLFGGWGLLGKVLLFTVPYHMGLGGILIWRLQTVATRVAEGDKG